MENIYFGAGKLANNECEDQKNWIASVFLNGFWPENCWDCVWS